MLLGSTAKLRGMCQFFSDHTEYSVLQFTVYLFCLWLHSWSLESCTRKVLLFSCRLEQSKGFNDHAARGIQSNQLEDLDLVF